MITPLKVGYETCPACGGVGAVREQMLAGYVSHDMATDAGDMTYEGEPVYETVDIECAYCEGTGEMKSEEVGRYRHPLVVSIGDVPF